MIVKIGNIFESKCSTIVNTVNCVGVMGKGIALDFKNRYPDMYMDYVAKCNEKLVKPGLPYIYKINDENNVMNFPTKDHWRSPSRLSYIVDGLNWIIDNYEKYNITSIALPPLGCGNGGLTWDVVGPIMYQKLSQLPINVEIYAPYGTSSYELSEEFLQSHCKKDNIIGKTSHKINPKWYLILQVVKELNERKYSLKVGRTIYQKICYVLTRNGIDTGFIFNQGNYGPFSSQVNESITILANANLLMEKQLGRMISMSTTSHFSINKVDYSSKEWEAVEKTVDLFGRVKSTEQAEMIATVLFAYDQLKTKKDIIYDIDVYNYVLNWKKHWINEKEFEISDSITNLAILSLMNVSYSGELMDTF